MSEIKVNSIKGVSASTAAISIDNSSGTCTANLTNRTNKNLILNGAFQIAQRSTSYTGGGYATVDRFFVDYAGLDEVPTQAQVDVASGTTPYTLGFRKAFKITNGNQTSGAGAGDILYINQKIEAQNIAQSGWNYTSSSSYITLSFWIKSSVAQTFKGNLKTEDGTAQIYHFETGSLTADTWTKITKTIPGNSNLQFDLNNENGLNLIIIPFSGTDFTDNSAVENAWQAYSGGIFAGKDNTSTWYTTNDATLEVTGFQLEVSDHVTDFEHRSFAEELTLCQRYFTLINADGSIDAYSPIGIGRFFDATQAQIFVPLPTAMRQPPTIDAISTTAANTFAINSGGSLVSADCNSVGLNERSFTSITLIATSSSISGQTTGMATTMYSHNTDNAKLGLTSEL